MDITGVPFSFPGIASVQCFFQSRRGGTSLGAYGGGNISYVTKDIHEHVLANRSALMKHVAYPFAELSQVHGDNLIFDPHPTNVDGKPEHEADGQATSKKHLALMIKTADCQPVLLAHKNGQHIMALHVGWRGNRMHFIQSAVARFCDYYGVFAHDLMAVRGPSLGLAEFVNFQKEWGDAYAAWFNAKNNIMDLWGLTKHQLQEAGLKKEYIFGLDLCTASMNDIFFSYRKEKESGRQASLIWITR